MFDPCLIRIIPAIDFKDYRYLYYIHLLFNTYAWYAHRLLSNKQVSSFRQEEKHVRQKLRKINVFREMYMYIMPSHLSTSSSVLPRLTASYLKAPFGIVSYPVLTTRRNSKCGNFVTFSLILPFAVDYLFHPQSSLKK